MFSPFNLKDWIDQHRDLLKPPVGNKMIWKDREFIVMAVGGPNQRTDYHLNEGEEFFYQVEGEMVLKIIDPEGNFKDISLKTGDIYLLPPNTPHSPQRMEKSVGVVIERKRRPQEKDGLQWYCQKCKNLLYEEFFHLKNIEEDFPPVFDRYHQSNLPQCKKCGFNNAEN